MTEIQISYIIDILPSVICFIVLLACGFFFLALYHFFNLLNKCDLKSKIYVILFSFLSILLWISVVLIPSRNVLRQILEMV